MPSPPITPDLARSTRVFEKSSCQDTVSETSIEDLFDIAVRDDKPIGASSLSRPKSRSKPSKRDLSPQRKLMHKRNANLPYKKFRTNVIQSLKSVDVKPVKPSKVIKSRSSRGGKRKVKAELVDPTTASSPKIKHEDLSDVESDISTRDKRHLSYGRWSPSSHSDVRQTLGIKADVKVSTAVDNGHFKIKFGKPTAQTIRKSHPAKRPISAPGGLEGGRKTINSLSATMGHTIHEHNPSLKKNHKTKAFGDKVAAQMKLCQGYIPSNRDIACHAAGNRYPKARPYVPSLPTDDSGKCAREDCTGDSKATIERHCISQYLTMHTRGSSIPKTLRLYWCNKCYMRYLVY